jgi:hypothetical protein
MRPVIYCFDLNWYSASKSKLESCLIEENISPAAPPENQIDNDSVCSHASLHADNHREMTKKSGPKCVLILKCSESMQLKVQVLFIFFAGRPLAY